jgi:hypothetical protein
MGGISEETRSEREVTAAACSIAAELISVYARRKLTTHWLGAGATRLEAEAGTRPGPRTAPDDLSSWRLTFGIILKAVNRRVTPGAPAGRRAEDMLIDRYYRRVTYRMIAEKYETSTTLARLLIEAGSIVLANEAEARGVTTSLRASGF